MQTFYRLFIGFGLIMLAVCLGAGQDKPALQIDFPKNGAIVHPGETIKVRVSSPSGGMLGPIAILGEDGIQATELASNLPAELTVLIPADIRPGEHMMSAVGGHDKELIFAHILLDVEMPEGGRAKTSLQKISFADAKITLSSQGQETWTRVSATYSDGQEVDITESSKLTFKSSDLGIVSVGPKGHLTALGQGTAIITATYLENSKKVQSSMRVVVEAEILSASPYHLSFGEGRGIQVGTSVTKKVILTYNVENPTIRIVNISVTGEFSQTNNCLSRVRMRTERTCTVAVTFTPTAPGERGGELVLHDNWGMPTTVPLTGMAAPR